MTPRATYRLQFAPGFGFRDAAAIAPYLADLGVSHVYASPFFAARAGSTHGYDIVDHNRLNPELGTERDFEAMCDAFADYGLGMIADFVPNHMGIGGASNAFWLSVLEWGRESPFAGWFDIDWEAADPALAGKVLVPFLGAAYGDVLADGGLDLRFDPVEGAFAVWAHGAHKLPVDPRDYPEILRHADLGGAADAFAGAAAAAGDPAWTGLKAGLAADPDAAARLDAALQAYRGHPGDLASWAALDALILRQHWRAAKFNLDRDAINYRRFFVISDLAGLRIEDPAVFDATHGLVLDLLARGRIDGIRIDHIDGLRDPKGYALRLRAQASRPFYLLVEKILAPDERLPKDWGADGTTGYEFANLMVGLMIDPAATGALTATYRDFTGRTDEPSAVTHAAKLEIMTGSMAAEIGALADRLHALGQTDPRTRDLGRNSLRTGLIAIIAGFDVYRTYGSDADLGPEDRARVEAAVAHARAQAPALDPGVFDFIASVLTLDLPGGEAAMRDCAQRIQQVSGPIMAKGVEDTALYRFNRLIALNEVGSEPGRYHVSIDAFHAANAERLADEPAAMLATSTHDTKRGEDARMRIAAISRDPERWRQAVFAWRGLLEPRLAPLDPNDVYFFFQLLLGAWPTEWRADADPDPAELAALRDRVREAMLKSVREAGVNSRWVFGDAAYERDLIHFIEAALDPGRSGAFLGAFREAAAHFGGFGVGAALAQTALKLTVPGMPDIYQGAELWEQSLVDPDNRRPVDFSRRTRMLADLVGAGVPTEPADLASGRTKLALTARLLACRREHPQLFARGAYAPLDPEAVPASVCAFVRRGPSGALLVAAALGWRSEDEVGWPAAARLIEAAGAGEWTDLLSGGSARPSAPLFARLPVEVLFRAPPA